MPSYYSLIRSVRFLIALCIGIMVSVPVTLYAQDARFKVDYITIRGNPLHTKVNCIMQDRYGYIWFGTIGGLHRYDGYELRSYTHNAYNQHSLSGHLVTAIAEDSSGNIWVGTLDGGLNKLDRHTEVITQYLSDTANDNSITRNSITALAADRSGHMWIGTTHGLCRLDTRSGKITRYDASDFGFYGTAYITSIFIDQKGRTWVANPHNEGMGGPSFALLSLYTPSSDTFKTWMLDPMVWHPKILGERANGMIDIGATRASPTNSFLINRFDPTSATTLAMDVVDTPVRSLRTAMMIDRTGDVWYTAHSGKINAVGGQTVFSIYCEPFADSQSGVREVNTVNSTPVVVGYPNATLCDRAGTVWIGMEDGLVRISRIGAGIVTWRHDPNISTSLSSRRIRSVLVDRLGTLWVGTDFGLNRYDPEIQGWHRYHSEKSKAFSLPNSTINTMYQDANGAILLGSNGMLSAYDAHHNRFYNHLPNMIRPGGGTMAVWSLLRDSKGRLWVGTRHFGLWLFDPSGKLQNRFNAGTTPGGKIFDIGVWCITETTNGSIWVGTNDGLCKWMPDKNEFKYYEHQPGNARSIGGKYIWALFEDSKGDLWVSSFGGGLCRYDKGTDDFTCITKRDGLITNDVFGFLEDDKGNFWISTRLGLVRWDRRANNFRVYGADDGLQGDEFAYKAFFKGPDGTMYFGGTNGLSAFNPANLIDNTFSPPTAITGFLVFDSLAAPGLNSGDTIHLDHTQNFFSFAFSALDYINPGKNKYAYMLEGIDPIWVYADSDHRLASYTDLAPGTYVFRLRASNNDGVWNEHGVMVTVIIAPPWWGTWLFRGLVILTIIGLAVFGVRLRTNEIRKHEQEKLNSAVQATLESQEIERHRIARDLHDGIGQLLAAAGINLARLRDIIDKRMHTETESAELHVPLERTEWILHRTSDDVRALSHALGTSTLHELGLTAALGELLANIEAQEKTRFEFVTVGMEDRLPEPMEIGLFRVAQELITNVLRHANATDASVQIMRDDDEVRLTVEDNGTGFDMHASHTGMGHRNIAARAAAIGGTLHYDSTLGRGTTVTVVVDADAHALS